MSYQKSELHQTCRFGDTYTDGDGTTLARLLDGQRVRLTKVGTPVTSSDGQNGKLGNGDGGANGGSDFLGGLDTETDVALGVTDEDDSLETGTLTSTGLLLDGLDLLAQVVSSCHCIVRLRFQSHFMSPSNRSL